MISDPTAVFIYLAALLGAIFWLTGLPRGITDHITDRLKRKRALRG